MTPRTKFFPGLIYPILLPFFLYLFHCGCSETTEDIPRSALGVNFFSMKNSSQLDTPVVQKIAKEEGLVLIKAGEFLMGSPEDEVGRSSDEKRNKVHISQPFWMKKFEVTQEEWNAYAPKNEMRGNPIYFLTEKQIRGICISSKYVSGHYSVGAYMGEKGLNLFLEEAVLSGNYWSKEKQPRNYKVNLQKFNDLPKLLEYLKAQNAKELGRLDRLLPVSRVSYSQVVTYCWEKTQRARLNGSLPAPLVYRLPTEAEWEYACRAGTLGVCGLGEGNFLSGENANINGSQRGYIIDQRPKSQFSDGGSFLSIFKKGFAPIREESPSYPSNKWGLFDMHGNVLEWCYDFYGTYPEGNHTRVDPIGPIRGSHRIVRGGSFIRTAHESRSAKRSSYEPSYRGSEIGFRYVLGLPLR